jgi:hypothetical protein
MYRGKIAARVYFMFTHYFLLTTSKFSVVKFNVDTYNTVIDVKEY